MRKVVAVSALIALIIVISVSAYMQAFISSEPEATIPTHATQIISTAK